MKVGRLISIMWPASLQESKGGGTKLPAGDLEERCPGGFTVEKSTNTFTSERKSILKILTGERTELRREGG